MALAVNVVLVVFWVTPQDFSTLRISLRDPKVSYFAPGGWINSYNTFIRNCGGSGSEDCSTSTVCHSFAARAEADVYLIGARRRWPPSI